MKKHLQYLERLCTKMETRYGKEDALVLELKQEIKAQEARKLRGTAGANLRRHVGADLAYEARY